MTWQDLSGTQIAGRYTLRTIRDAGSHHGEFAATDSDADQKPVSVALIVPEPGQAAEELATINRARQLRHPNLLQILDAGECVLDEPLLFIVTEAAECTLAGTLAAGPVTAPAALLEDIVAALEWLHGQGLVYRNLEPETVVRAERRWKLADLSQLHQAGEFAPIHSAGRSVPPEAAAGSILPAWDVWALGLLLRDVSAAAAAVPGERGVLPTPFDFIMRGCLEPDPGRRLTLPDIRKMLKPLLKPIPIAYAVPEVQPVSLAEYNPLAPSRARALIAPISIAALLILIALAFFFLRRDRNTAPPNAAPQISHPAAAPLQRQDPAVTAAAPPPPAKPSAIAPAQNTGLAEYFADDLEGHVTASGEPFRNQGMTAAHRQFRIGTRLRVTNLENGHSVTVRVNDRGPHRRGFIISVTRRAAEQLGFVKAGSARVKLEVVK